MNKTNIEWCDYTWNPITGCKRGCSYCYAKRLFDRFKWHDFNDITLHYNRLKEPFKIKKPSVIFVGSMTDIYYWSTYCKSLINMVAISLPQHTFMLLSKDPNSYKVPFQWSGNIMCGLTVQTDRYHKGMVYRHGMNHRPWISIEPLLGIYHDTGFENFEKVIVGAQTGPGSVTPKAEWIQSIVDSFEEDDIFWKNNIKKYIKLIK